MEPSQPTYSILQSPEVKAKIQFTTAQWVGMPLIFLIPVLSLLGIFGIGHKNLKAESDQLIASLNYPHRIRHHQENEITLAVSNKSSSTLKTEKCT